MPLDITDWLIRLALTVLFCGVVGFEREASQKAAGLRTNIMVGLGAALFGLISLEGFDGPDPARIAAQVVTGVGFLGAGVIFRQGPSVQGLTTAASLWAVAAIGLATGAGELAGAAIGTVLAVIVLYGLRYIEILMRHRAEAKDVPVDVELSSIERMGAVLKMAGQVNVAMDKVRFRPLGPETGVVRLYVSPESVPAVKSLMASVDGVVDAERADD